ncbi:tRNA (adenosine(37)-N6)-threonylcarbamoyltransferase complex ATPase subunit type 1 TsaE [Hydrogenimonas sp.]
MTRTYYATLEELDETARQMADALPEDLVLFLRGDLASGKTTLTQALARARGVAGPVTSPTFSIQQVYGEGFYHYDLYQCSNEKFMAMGLIEALEEPGWHLVEWGDEALRRSLASLGLNTAIVKITPEGEGRRYEVETYA